MQINTSLFLIIFRRILFPVFFVCAGIVAHAQNFYQQAEKLFQEKKYFEAAQYYEQYLAGEQHSKARAVPFAPEKKVKGKANLSVHEEAVYHLAESYRLYNNYSKAEKWYREATQFSATAYPECRYWYAVTLRANMKYKDAISVLDTFLQTYTTMGPVLVSADREYKNLQFIAAQMARTNTGFTIQSAQQQKGSTSSYAMAMKTPDTLVFTSIQEDSALQKDGSMQHSFTNELFESADDQNIFQHGKMISTPATGKHNGLATFTRDGKKMFFTQWIKKTGGNISAIYMREKTDTGWTTPVKLDERINAEGYNSAQPFITSDSKYLLFASDKPGGVGNYDIWFAVMDSNLHVLSVSNMGPVVNTTADEESPFYHTRGRTLIFSSNGRVGMGGFDIYSAKGDPGFTNWEKPVNPGMPLNSVKDDLYYVCTDDENLWNTGWVSSDRSSDCCLALFHVMQNNRQYVQGMVVDCNTGKPLEGVKITVMDTRHKANLPAVNKSGRLGTYAFELSNASGIRIHAEREGYVPKDSSFSIHIQSGHDTINSPVICLVLVADTVRKKVNDLLASLSRSATIGNFIYQKANLNSLAYSNLDSLTEEMNKYPEIKIQIGGYTDGNGSVEYNIRLAQARVDVCIKYLVKKGVSPDRLIGKAFGKCCPLEAETIDGKDNPEARAKNRRVEYTVIEAGNKNPVQQ